MVMDLVVEARIEDTSSLLDKAAMMTTPSPHQVGHAVVGSPVGQDFNDDHILTQNA